MSTAIQTKFGPAKIGKNGYYYISDKSTGLYLKLLHRLVFEDFYKINCPQCNQGFSWVYQYYDENGKQQAIHSVNLLKLKQKVINRGQDWFVINNRNALKTCVKYDYLLSEVC